MNATMRRMAWLTCASIALVLVGCDDGGKGTGGDSDAGAIDSGVAPDAGPLPSGCMIPEDGFGTDRGRKLRPFTLDQCDGTSYSFYNAQYCDPSTRLTVVSIAAGWCVPCQHESEQLTAAVTNVYGPQGVRVIQVLVQDPYNRPPTREFCENWVSTYRLVNTELMDPLQITNIYFPARSLPSTIIVDNTGTIRFRENGATNGLVTLRTALDELLAE